MWKRIIDNNAEDIMLLCKTCHEEIHNKHCYPKDWSFRERRNQSQRDYMARKRKGKEQMTNA